jgi:hypothetical protein
LGARWPMPELLVPQSLAVMAVEVRLHAEGWHFSLKHGSLSLQGLQHPLEAGRLRHEPQLQLKQIP